MKTMLRTFATTRLELIDCAPLHDIDALVHGFYVAACGINSDRRQWRGCQVFRSLDDGRIFRERIATIRRPATIGVVRQGGEGWAIVDLLIQRDLVSVSAVAFEQGANACVFGDEACRYRTAVLQDNPLRYELSNIVRKDGTVACPVEGTRFVVMNAAVVRVPIDASMLGKEYVYMAQAVGLPMRDGIKTRFTCRGRTTEKGEQDEHAVQR